jgi:hypothetical protein
MMLIRQAHTSRRQAMRFRMMVGIRFSIGTPLTERRANLAFNLMAECRNNAACAGGGQPDEPSCRDGEPRLFFAPAGSARSSNPDNKTDHFM